MATRRKIFELFGSIVIEGTAKNKKALTELQKNIRATNKALNKMGKDAAKVGGLITKGLTAPLLGVAAAVTKVGADFDEAMTNSLSIMDDVSDAMRNDMEKTAREVAKDLNLSVVSMGEAYFFLASAGLDAAKSMKALPEVAAFAKANNIDLAKATDDLTDAQSALGLNSEDTATHIENMIMVSDLLTQANNDANSSAIEYAAAIKNGVGVELALLKKPLSEGLAALEVFADKGFAKSAEAGTQLGIVFRELKIKAVENAAAFKAANVDVFDNTTGNMNHLADIVEQLSTKLSGLSDKEKVAQMAALGFTAQSQKSILALLGTSEALREYEKDLVSTGQTQAVAAKQLKGFWEQVGLAKTAVIDLGLTLFDKLQPILEDHILPTIKNLTESIASLFEWFEKHPIISDFVATFVIALGVMGPLLLTFAKFLPLIKSTIALYKVLTASQITLNAVMATNPVGLIVTAIGLLIAAGVALYKNWDVVKEVFIDTWETILFHLKNVASTIATTFAKIYLGILEGINKVGQFIPGVNKGLEKIISTLKKGVEVLDAQTVARKALHKAQELSKKLTKDEEKVIKAATIATIENGETAEEVAEKKKIATLSELEAKKKAAEDAIKFERDAARESFDISKKLFKAKAKLEEDSLAKVKKATAQKLIENEFEKTEAIRIATEKGMETAALEALFKAQEDVIKAESRLKEAEIAAATTEERIKSAETVFNVISGFVGSLNKIWQGSLDNRIAEIDAEHETRRIAIEKSGLDEEQRAIAIAEIDEELNEKKQVLRKENAKREKAATLLGIALATALAITQALPIIPLSIAVGVLGAVQLGIAAAQPIPFAEGGLVRADPGTGIVAQVGEGKEDELVLPMKTGAAELASNIFGKMKGFGSDVLQNRGSKVTEVHNHWHVGTFIGDERGIKILSKKINKFQVAERQRTGVSLG